MEATIESMRGRKEEGEEAAERRASDKAVDGRGVIELTIGADQDIGDDIHGNDEYADDVRRGGETEAGANSGEHDDGGDGGDDTTAAGDNKTRNYDDDDDDDGDDSNTAAGDDKRGNDDMNTVPLWRLFWFADRLDWLLMGAGSLGSLVHGAATPAYFLLFGRLVNSFGTHQDDPAQLATTVGKNALNLVYLGLIVCISTWIEVTCWMHASERQASKMRVKYLESILRQDIGFFDTDARVGAILNSLASDTIFFQDAISEKMGNFLHFLATFVGGFVVGFASVWKIALVTLAVVPAIAFAGGLYAFIMTQLSSKSQQAYGEAGSIAEQTIAQIRIVYAFVGESKALESYSKSLEVTKKLGYKAGLGKGLGMGATYGILFCSWALVLWYASTLIRHGTTNGGKAIAATFSVIIGGLALGQAMNCVSTFAKGKAAAFRILKMVEKVSKINSCSSTTPTTTLVDVKGDIEFQDVDFSYPSRPNVPIFKKFSLKIPSGKTVAIVGSSGSGKSTIVSLIERFYDPISGRVLLDNVDIKTLEISWLRDQIGLVNQEPTLFATSILDNILYGKPKASMKDVEEVAKVANAHAFISDLPCGYHTQVGERGVQLSGGQKQRIAIARAMLKNPKVLLLDEATSALDATSEHVVQDALDHIMVGRSTIVIAHRLSTIRHADSIAVVQEGAIVEQGDHEELMAKGDKGAYVALLKLQNMVEDSQGSTARVSSRRSSTSDKRLSQQGRDSIDYPYNLKLEEFSKDHNKKKDSYYFRLAKLNASEWPYVVLAIMGAVLSGCMNPVFSVILSHMLEVYYYKDHHKLKVEVTKYAFIILGLAATQPLIFFLQHYNFGIMGENLTNRVRELIFKSILQNEVGWFDSKENNSTKLTSHLATDATNVRAAVVDMLSLLAQNLTLVLASCIVSLVGCWQMALVMIATLPLLVASALAEQLGMKGLSRDLEAAHVRANTIAGEAVGNVRTVAAFNAQNKILDLVATELKGPERASFLRGNVAGGLYGLALLSTYCSYALTLWYGAVLVRDGRAEFGDVIRVFMVLVITAMGVAEALGLSPDVVRAGHALGSVFSIIDRRTLIDAEAGDTERAAAARGDVELRHVAFAYPTRPDVAVFTDLSLRVGPGESLALVGPSGSGKSSVLSLILRFYDVTGGQVLIDGADVRQLRLRSLRRRIGLVQQEPSLFAASVRENILYGRPGASQADVEAAASAANAHAFICALPRGYDTEVGERGVQLSGGQRQRVAIARAVARDPAVLLLDEATSALDAASERVVQEALERVMGGRTTVLVAHRLSTVRRATTIAVVQDGRIVEQGPHHTLVTKPNGAYAHLVNLQQGSLH